MKKILVSIILSFLAIGFAQTEINWFVGLGTGSDPEQQAKQNAVVDAFNAAHKDIKLKITYVENSVAANTLATLMATGEAPDIIGPVGIAGSNRFHDNFLDVEPYLKEMNFDFSQFPKESVDFYRTADGLVGLPLANYPSFLMYRPELFEEAGLEMPPAKYGDPYVLDGQKVTWDIDTMSKVAKILTVDANGNDASMAVFDPENIVQFGYVNQWADPLRQNLTLFGADTFVDEDGTAYISDNWRKGIHWYYDAMWKDHFMPNAAQRDSDLLASGNTFASGHVAMAQAHLWYTCCLEDSNWNAAALPSYNGNVTAKLHADTFRVLSSTKHPKEAVEVLAYLIGPASLDLLSAYGGLPARPKDQPAFFKHLNEKYPQGVNWDVVMEGFKHPDIPSHESYLPNDAQANDRLNSFRSLLDSEPNLDVDSEIDRLIFDLQLLFDKAKDNN